MLNHSKKPEEILPEEKISGYGGYAARHEYEKSRAKKKTALAVLQGILLLTLIAFSVLGVISLIRGDFLPKSGSTEGGGTIKVPTRAELAEVSREKEEMIEQVEQSLVTVEVEWSDGTFRYGTGFIADGNGSTVCSSTLFVGEGEIVNVTAYTADGVSVAAELKGKDDEAGVALLYLPHEYQYNPIPLENSFFVKRGKTLSAVSSNKPKVFYGTVTEGVVGSVGPSVKLGEEEIHTNVIYLEVEMNPTLYGAVVVDESGAAVGFLSGTLPPLYGSLAPVIPINIVYTMINEF